MITTMDAVGAWSWETGDAGCEGDPLVPCVRLALDVWSVLRTLGLAEACARADIAVRTGSEGAVVPRAQGVRVDFSAGDAERALLEALSEPDRRNVGLATIDLELPGGVLRAGDRYRAEQLFSVTVDVWPSGAASITLRTYSDAWLSHDLRGRRQPDVQKENAPRLKAALAAVTDLLGVPIEPWDPGFHGTPTEDGFEDFPDDDPDLLDSWYMFEVPRRTEWLQGKVPQEKPHYESHSSAPVDFAEVSIDGRVIGYVWADESGEAAGYEPRSPAGRIAFDAAEDWLDHLSGCKARGLPSSQALREAVRRSGTDRSGAVVSGSLRKAISAEEVQELSGREW
ncbi:hypothetical protein ABZ719_12340 [Streptomyces sp. NPDC006743]|uniref:hypothetical protein n=1 Tax=Streptomyces sp. NPDC006743 TaxID=3154480 RepID=UPI0034521DFB